MKRQRKKRPSNIGRRTGVDIAQGKSIRIDEDGNELFNDYWTDSDSVISNQTIQSLRSPYESRSKQTLEKVSNLDSDSGSLRNYPRSSPKKVLNDEHDYEDSKSYSSPEQSESSRSSNIFEDVENAALGRPKMTQTSNLSVETERSVSTDRINKKLLKTNRADLTHDINSSLRKSKILSCSSRVQRNSEHLPLSRDGVSVSRVSLLNEMSLSEVKKKRNSKVLIQTAHPHKETECSPYKNRKIVSNMPHIEETRKNRSNSSDDGNISVENDRVLSESSHSPNLMRNLRSISHSNAANLSTSKLKSITKVLDTKNSRVMKRSSYRLDETKSSPVKNTTFMAKRSFLNEMRENQSDSSDIERSLPVKNTTFTAEGSNLNEIGENHSDSFDSEKSSVKRYQVLSKTSNAPNRDEDLPSPRDHVTSASSPTKNTSYMTKRSYTKETEKNQVDSSGSEINSCEPEILHPVVEIDDFSDKNKPDSGKSEKNSSVRRSPRVLCKTMNTFISKTEVNRRNSLRRPPQYASKSFKELNLEENASYRRSVNKSQSLVSERENDKRKSSIGKTPIVIKRKMRQALDTSENFPSKTSPVQNSRKEKKRDFPGKKSLHHVAIPAELLDPKETVDSINGKIVDRSKILKLSQNDGDGRKSSSDKASTSEDNALKTTDVLERRQVSKSAGSRMKNASKAKHKTSVSKAVKDHLQEGVSSLSTVRISSRGRRIFPPLASWRNERIKFVKTSSGEFECAGVDEGRPEDDAALKMLLNRMSRRNLAPIKKRKIKLSKIPVVVDSQTNKTTKLELYRPFSKCDWCLPPNESNSGYMLCRNFSTDFASFGFLSIAGHGKKDRQLAAHNVHFVVVKGVVETQIHETCLTCEKGDSFIVPLGSAYCISNSTSSNALLTYCTYKMPFFKYQV